METIRDIQIRLKSINNTRQITESMRMIATRKVQRLRTRMDENRPYLEQSVKIISSMAKDPDIAKNVYIAEREPNTSLVIVITGDRGLCGGYNANASKEAHLLVNGLSESSMITIGSKGRDYFRRRQKNIIHTFKGLSESPLYEDAQNIGDIALKLYTEKTVDQVFIVYTQYFSMLSQIPKTTRILPLDKSFASEEADSYNNMSYDTDKEEYFESAAVLYAYSFIFGAMLESAVSEQCARVAGMDSASKNSDKIIDSLTLQYNQMRQGAITQEIAEIVGGASAIKKS